MVITTPFITKYIDDMKPYKKLFPPPASEMTIVVREKGVKCSWSKTFLDRHVMKKRITIGRLRNSSLQIDRGEVSRLHAVIECNPKTGKWTFEDIQSMNGSIVNGKRLNRKTTLQLENNDKIKIGKYRWKLCHLLEIKIHYFVDDLPKAEKPPLPRRLTWRRSLYCNGCMGHGPRHSCTIRVSILRKLVLDANRKSNEKAARLPNTLVQKALMRRGSYWWPKKPGEDRKKVMLEIPANYNDPPEQSVMKLPDYGYGRPPSTAAYPVFNPNLSI
ncbi:hypothetical protein R1flu_004507 [Riccia fluitans]|uniref:FHA domain-containing protein n=1 Tax=Riccia fluitans TaxID=41844 RepID=A0ABD1YQR2_9MARC